MDILTSVHVQYWVLGGWTVACGAYDLSVRRLPQCPDFGGSWRSAGGACGYRPGLAGRLTVFVFRGMGVGAGVEDARLCVQTAGGGDVKLLAAMGLAGGLEAMLTAYAVAGLLVGGTAVVWMMAYRWEPLLAAPLARIGINFPAVPKPKDRILLFGVGLAIGFVVALVAGFAHSFDLS
jgi:prepilin peptidase CpaA